MIVLNELLERKVIKSKRELSRLLGRASNYICESAGAFAPADLIELRLHLLRVGGHTDLIEHIEGLVLSSWRSS